MNRLESCVWVLVALLALLIAARAQTTDHPVPTDAKEFSAELDALIAHQQYARAEQMVGQRLAGGDDPAVIYFQIGKVYFNHEVWQRSAGFLEKSLKFKGMNDDRKSTRLNSSHSSISYAVF